MNRFQKRIIGITSALASLTFAMITAAVGTVAWFVASARQQASGMSVEAGSPEISIDYKVFRYDFNKKEGRGWANTASQFYLPDYEVFLKDPSDDFFSNAHTNAILMATVELGDLDTELKELNFNITCSNSSSYETNSKVNPYTSNIAQFKCFLSSYLVAGETEEDNIYGIDINDTDKNIYNSATEIFNQIETPTTFVSVNGTVYNKTQNTLTITPYLPQGIHLERITFFVECSYNERLVNHYLSTHSSEIAGSYFDISGDVEKIVVTTSDNTKGTSNSGKYIKLKSQYNVIDSNYLLLHRESLVEEGSDEGVVLDGALSNDDLTKGRNTQRVDIVDNTVTTNPDINAAAFKYTIDDPNSEDYKKLESSKFRHNGDFYAYSDSNRLPIGNKSQTTAQILRSNSGYTNNINVRSDGYADVTSITGDENPDTHLWFNDTSTVQGFKYYKASQDRGNTIKDIEVFRYAENAAAVGELVRIEIQGTPKTQYYTTTPFDRSGFRVIAYYSDGGRFDVSDLVTYSIGGGIAIGDDEITSFIATHGDTNQTIVCSYEEYDGNVQTTSYNIHITQAGISSVTIYQNPSITTYYEGQTMNYTGLILSINYNDGRASELVYYGDSRILYKTYAQGATLSYTGLQHTVVVGIGTFEASFKITVNMKSVTISSTSTRVKLGETITISGSTTPSGQALTWSLDDYEIASISSSSNTQCVIQGDKVGNVTVQATITGTSRKSNTIEIEVYDSIQYTKVTSEPADWSGTYLIVYERSSTNGYVFDATKGDAQFNYIEKAISSVGGKDVITVDSRLTSQEFTISKESSSYYLTDYLGRYVHSSSNSSNTLVFDSTKTSINISSGGTGVWSIYSGSNSGRMLQWNNLAQGSGGQRFRFMNSNASYYYPSLYKIASDKTEVGFDKTNATLVRGDQFQLNVSITPGKDNYSLSDIAWSMPNDATFNDSTGVLTWTPGNSATSTIITGTLPNGKSATCTISVAWLKSIDVSGQQTSFNINSSFVFGGTVTAHFTTDGTNIDSNLDRNVTSDAQFSGYNMSTAGTQTVTVKYTKGGTTATKTYSITITASSTKTYTLTILPSDFNGTSYNANNGDHTKSAVATDGTTKVITYNTNQIMLQSGVMQWQKSNGKMYNITDLGTIKSITIDSSAGTFTTYYGTSQNPSSGTTVGGKYFSIKVGGALGKTSSVKIVFTI